MDYRQLAKDINKAAEELQKVDVSGSLSDDDLDLYEGLRAAAYDLISATNYVIDG